MKLIDDWKKVVLHAWSFKLMVLSAVLDAAERALPYLDQSLLPPGMLGIVALVVLAAAAIMRVVPQKEFSNVPDPADSDKA